MDKKVYLSVDGGGTKVITMLFDENFNFLADGKGGSINSNFTKLQDIIDHMKKSMDDCLGKVDGVTEIECVYISMPGPYELYIELLKNRVIVKDYKMVGEGQNGMDSAGISRGITAVCGTGSDVFYIDPQEPACMLGGWGSPFGDFGSGYYIGLNAIQAAIASYETWGIKTELEEAIVEYAGTDTLWNAVMRAYKDNTDARRYVSGLCLTVEKCALNGDQAARTILEKAGEIMATQAQAFIRKYSLPNNLKIATTGGVWKEEKFMRASFIRHMQGFYPNVTVVKPLFEPVMGPVVKLAMGEDENISESNLQILKENFSKYVFE